MSTRWRLFVVALRFGSCEPPFADASVDSLASRAAARFLPLAGITIGLVGAAGYWLAAQWWPSSIAVILSMLATILVTANFREWTGAVSAAGLGPSGERVGAPYWVFVLLVKYNALMALSAASLPFPVPDYVGLGLIMIAAHAASRALVVSLMATHTPSSPGMTAADFGRALILGLAPAALLGIPGLVGLAGAIAMRLALGAYVFPKLSFRGCTRFGITQHLTEICFYLGALASWKYV